MTILVFDSGIGGLTVLREARVLMADRKFVYVADDAAFPYGDWEEEALSERMVKLFGELISRWKPEICVIACNSGMVSVLATPGTVKRQYTRDLIEQYASKCHVTLVGSTKLAALSETYMRGGFTDEEAVKQEIMPCFVGDGIRRTDIVVLACTHYPFLANRMRKMAPWPVDWIDTSEAIARRAADLLKDNTLSENGDFQHGEDIAYFTSGSQNAETLQLLAGFGLKPA